MVEKTAYEKEIKDLPCLTMKNSLNFENSLLTWQLWLNFEFAQCWVLPWQQT